MFELYQKINGILENGRDPRTLNWFLTSYVTFTLSILIYLFIIKVILPTFMKNREAYKLTKVLIVYNTVQVILSAYLFILGAESWFFIIKATLFKCNSVDFSTSSESVKVMKFVYLYFLSKYTEFFDTFFFILRKKYSQVSFLHVYHHVSTPIFSWVLVRYYPGGSFTLILWMNALVHIVMYTYYLLAGLGPHMQPYLAWKKYITTMQLIQFATGTVHFAVAACDSNCNIPRTMLLLYTANGVMLLVLFSNFYKKQYRKKPAKEDIIPQIERSNSIGRNLKNGKSITENITESSTSNNNLKKRILL